MYQRSLKGLSCACGTPLIYAVIEFGPSPALQPCFAGHIFIGGFNPANILFASEIVVLSWFWIPAFHTLHCGNLLVDIDVFFPHVWMSDYPTKHLLCVRHLLPAPLVHFFLDQNLRPSMDVTSMSLLGFLVASQRTGIPQQGNREPACLTRAPHIGQKGPEHYSTLLLRCVCGGSALQAGWVGGKRVFFFISVCLLKRA